MSLYVAYGSNLHLGQMEYRCPGATIFAKGVIDNYKLVYRGSKTGAYATIIPSPGDKVPVVVWNINRMHERSLDRYEGFPRFYYKEFITVRLESKRVVKAMVYIMFDEAKVGKPSMQYLTTVAEGYLANKLDMEIFEESIAYNEYELA